MLKFAGMLFYLFKSYKKKSVPDYPIIHFYFYKHFYYCKKRKSENRGLKYVTLLFCEV